MIRRFLKHSFVVMAVSVVAAAQAQAEKGPKFLGDYLEVGKVAKGEIVQIDIPAEFTKFQVALAKASQKHPEWFKAAMKANDPGNPIPKYHENLGITKKEYDKYLALWEKRGLKRVEKGLVALKLEKDSEGLWTINVSGFGWPISLLKYDEKKDVFISTNGEMKRIEDINSPKSSVYRDWNGQEWKHFEQGGLVDMKENFAIGRSGDGRYGMLIYSLQEVSSKGTPLADDLMVIRFAPKPLKK